MRQIFIGLFIIAFLAGVTAKMMKDSKDETSFVGHFFNAVGLKKKENAQKIQIDRIVHQFALQKENTKDYVKLQQESLTSSKALMSSLSQLIQERLDRDSNMDLIRLKDTMQKFQDKSALLIEHGQQIIEFNDKQSAINQKIAEEAERSSIISDSDRVRFEDNIRSSLDQQINLMDQQKIKVQDLHNTMQQILDQANQIQSDIIFKQNTEIVQKLQAVSDKTKLVLDKVEEQKIKLEEINRKNLETLSAMKEKMEDMQRRSLDSVSQSRRNVPDKAKEFNDRLRDKLDRMQDQRMK